MLKKIQILTWSGEFLAKNRWSILIFTLVVTALLAGPAWRLKLDESIESLYDPADPLLINYLESKELFGGDEFVLVAYETDDATNQANLRALNEFSEKLQAVPGVRAESTQDLWQTLRNPRAAGLVRIALRLPVTERALLKVSDQITVGEDLKTYCIVLRLEDEEKAGVSRAQTITEIRSLADAHEPPAFVAGEPIQIFDMFRYVDQDSWRLGIASSGLMMLVILFFFKNIRWVVLPIVIIQVTLLWTCGLLEISGIELSMVSSMLTSLVTVIGIAMTMHITVIYREYRLLYDRNQAFVKTYVHLTVPMFWVSLTTAIGFASLLNSGATPVRSFSLMMAVGSMLVPLLILLIMPAGILVGKIQADPRTPTGDRFLIQQLTKASDWAVSHPWSVTGLTLLFSCVGFYGLMQLKVETDFSKNFRSHSPVVKAIDFFESRMGGAGSWEVSFSVPKDFYKLPFETLRELNDELRELELPDGTKLTKVVSLVDGVDLVPRIPLSGEERQGLFRAIPQFRDALMEERREMMNQLQPEMEPSLYHEAAGKMRVMLRAHEQRPAEIKLELIKQVEAITQKYFPDAKATGLYVLLTHLISGLLGDQVQSFMYSSLGILISMIIAFRSLTIGSITLVPNILPLLLVIGGMGFVGIPVNIGTAMIASVSIGITVDTTIMYVEEYLRARRTGLSHTESVHYAHSGAGLAVLLANISLIVGFSVLTLSNFVPMIYFGVLVSLAMLGGLIGNLLLLPGLLKFVKVKVEPTGYDLIQTHPLTEKSQAVSDAEPSGSQVVPASTAIG